MLNFLQKNEPSTTSTSLGVRGEKKILWLAIILYFLIFSAICIWKYFQFGYNGLDLAIYNQVFYNSAHGQLFHFTIHPQSYLGDHFELIILLILPFYYLFQHPVSLLIFQSLILALCAWPLYLIVKKSLPAPYSLLIALGWLLNPFVQNINLFEFHILPFAIFFLFWAFYFYLKNRFWAFLFFAFCSLLVREDVALVILMFSVLALFDRRKLKWFFWPAFLSLLWFIFAIKATANFSPDGQYKFLYYYSWLGANLQEIMTNALTHPLLIIKHLATWNNLFFTLGLFLPFCYLIKPKYLLLGLLIYLQIILGGSGNSTVALKLHYTALLLPVLFIAFIYAIKEIFLPLPATAKFSRLKKFLIKERGFTIILISITVIYSTLTLGPLLPVTKYLIKPAQTKEQRDLKKEFIASIPAKSSLATTYEFLTVLSLRPKVYSLHYAFIGKRQFSNNDYALPPDVETLLIDFDDFLTYGLQFPHIKAWQEYYQNGDDNIRKLVADNNFKVSRIADSLVIMERYNDLGVKLYETSSRFDDIEHPQNITLVNQIKFLGWSKARAFPASDDLLPISLYFQPIKKLEKNYQFKLILKDKNDKIIYEKYYPLAYGLYPTTEWQNGEIVKINYWFLIPEKLKNANYQTEVQLVKIEGYITLNGLRSVVPKITKEKLIGPPLILAD